MMKQIGSNRLLDMKTDAVQKILLLNYLGAFGVVNTLFFLDISSSLVHDLYGVLFLGFIPILGGINGLFVAKQWGFFKSAVGRSIIFLSLGLISWGLGTCIFSGVYNFLLGIEVPYPSWADVGYVLALPLWTLAVIQLARATGAKYGLRSLEGKSLLLIIPAFVVILSYYLLVVVAREGSLIYSDTDLKIFFDLAYPIGDVVILTLTTLVYSLSYNYFGGIFKKAIYTILGGFVIMYIADFAFSYTTTLGIWHPGDWVDLLFTTAMLGLAMGIGMFSVDNVNREG